MIMLTANTMRDNTLTNNINNSIAIPLVVVDHEAFLFIEPSASLHRKIPFVQLNSLFTWMNRRDLPLRPCIFRLFPLNDYLLELMIGLLVQIQEIT